MIKISTNWVLWPGKQLGALFFLSESDKKEINFFSLSLVLLFNRSEISLVFLSPAESFINRRTLAVGKAPVDVSLRRKKLVPWHARHYSRLFSVIKETSTAIAHHQHGRRSSGTTWWFFFVSFPISRRVNFFRAALLFTESLIAAKLCRLFWVLETVKPKKRFSFLLIFFYHFQKKKNIQSAINEIYKKIILKMWTYFVTTGSQPRFKWNLL